MPVTYRGGSAIVSAALAGPHAADYSVTAGGCVGHFGPCDVVVRFARTAPGTRRATLRLTDAAGGVHETALEGFAHDGTTDAELEVLAGDVAGQPGTYRYDPTTAFFAAQNHDVSVNVFLDGEDGRHYLGRFGTGGTTPLEAGSYPTRTNIPSGRPFLDAWGTPTGCNRTGGGFTVHSIERMPDGTLRSLDVSFELLCYQDHRPALRGRWRWRAERRTARSVARARAAPADRRPTRRPRPAGVERPGGQVPAASGAQAAAPAARAAARPRSSGPSRGVGADRRQLARRAAIHPRAAAGRARPARRCRGAGALPRPLLLPPPLGAHASRPCRRRAAPGARPLPPRDCVGAPRDARRRDGKGLRYAMRRGRRPAVSRLCLPPGSLRPARCAA